MTAAQRGASLLPQKSCLTLIQCRVFRQPRHTCRDTWLWVTKALISEHRLLHSIPKFLNAIYLTKLWVLFMRVAWDNSVGIATRYRLDGPRFEPHWGWGVFCFPQSSRPVLVSTPPPVQWVAGYFPGIKLLVSFCTNPHLSPMLRMSTDTPLCLCLVWHVTGRPLPLRFIWQPILNV
jgi:hypothetical protein